MSILALFLILNAITCILYGIDKWKAIHGAWRIREATLLTWTALGGSLGAFLGMHLFHHKTRHKKFRLLVPSFEMSGALGIACHMSSPLQRSV